MIDVLAIVAAILVIAIATLLMFAAMRPDQFRIARSIRIEAPPERIFPLVNDLRNFRLWSPYETKDPAMKRTFSEPASGKGATYDWEGNSNVGKGRLVIADSVPPRNVTIDLDMIKPIEAHNIVEFTFEPAGTGTNVTWSMRGPVPFLGKIMHTIFDMEKMVGRDFETGLAKLKAAAEA